LGGEIQEGGRIRLEVYIQPGASKTELAGLHGGCIKIRIAAPPVDNAAFPDARCGSPRG